jgi:hypothetical protein
MAKTGPGNCSVCAHRERHAIDLAIARGVSMNAVAKRADLHPDAVKRHVRNHLTPQMRAKLIAGPDLDGIDLDRLKTTESQSLLLHLVNLRNRLFATMDTAEEFGDNSLVLGISGQLHRNFELVGKLLGDLGMGNTTVTNNMLLVSPAYLELRQTLVHALRAHPEAARDVAAALHVLESKAAQAIESDTSRKLAALPTKMDKSQARTIELEPATRAKPMKPRNSRAQRNAKATREATQLDMLATDVPAPAPERTGDAPLAATRVIPPPPY